MKNYHLFSTLNETLSEIEIAVFLRVKTHNDNIGNNQSRSRGAFKLGVK